jgi:ribosome-associated protein
MVTAEDIPPDSCKFTFVHSSGPGGQHVNKASTAVELKVLLEALPFNPGVMRRIRSQNAGKINKNGELTLQVDSFRSQLQNKKDAIERLLNIINKASIKPKARIATAPTRAAKAKRLDGKKRKGLTKAKRSRPRPSSYE